MSPRDMQTDAQDLASAALLKLAMCPKRLWNEPYAVKRLIVNAIIDESRKQQKVFENEWQAPHTVGNSGNKGERVHSDDWFDTQPGRDGLAEHTRIKLDSEKIQRALDCLNDGERLVITLFYGLETDAPLKEYAIASRLGRTVKWTQNRLQSGLARIRQEIGVTV
jgi:DNA-directed RNA polymerase specialized sigma24 family protein